MKRLKIILISICILAVCFLGGCSSCNINDRSQTAYVTRAEEGDYYIYNIMPYTLSEYALKVNKTTGEMFLDESGTDDDQTAYPTVIWGSDFPRYSIECGEGYEKLVDLLIQKYETGSAHYVQLYAVEYDYENKVAYGFCNRYSSAKGFLSGGGNIDADNVIGSVFFSYNLSSEEFIEICALNCNIVAFNCSKLIYFKNKKYYAYDTATDKSTFICDDEAYDSGFTNYSHATFLFDGELCLIIMYHDEINSAHQYEKLVVADYEANVLFTQKWSFFSPNNN